MTDHTVRLDAATQRQMASKLEAYKFWRKRGKNHDKAFHIVMCGSDWSNDLVSQFEEKCKIAVI